MSTQAFPHIHLWNPPSSCPFFSLPLCPLPVAPPSSNCPPSPPYCPFSVSPSALPALVRTSTPPRFPIPVSPFSLPPPSLPIPVAPLPVSPSPLQSPTTHTPPIVTSNAGWCLPAPYSRENDSKTLLWCKLSEITCTWLRWLLQHCQLNGWFRCKNGSDQKRLQKLSSIHCKCLPAA